MADSEAQSDFPEAWRPEEGDKIKGRVVSVAMGPDFGYGAYPIVTITDAAGNERAIHAMHRVLRTELARRRPGHGDEIEVTYVGKRAPKSGNGNPFHVYRVKGGKPPEFNWDAELPEGERQGVQRSSAPPIAPSRPARDEPFTPPASFQPQPKPTGEQFGDDVPF
jgi:hypothetical protein